jgi:hypothetical protein
MQKKGEAMNENKKEQLDEGIVYDKTEKGLEEIQTRKNNLQQRFRTLLIVVDGKKTRGGILKQFSTLEGAAAALDELEQKGFIMKKVDVPAPAVLAADEEQQQTKRVKAFMLNTLNDAVGSMGLSLIESLRRCETIEGLKSHFENYLYAIKSGRGKATAEEYRTELHKYFTSD